MRYWSIFERICRHVRERAWSVLRSIFCVIRLMILASKQSVSGSYIDYGRVASLRIASQRRRGHINIWVWPLFLNNRIFVLHDLSRHLPPYRQMPYRREPGGLMGIRVGVVRDVSVEVEQYHHRAMYTGANCDCSLILRVTTDAERAQTGLGSVRWGAVPIMAHF